MSFLVGWIKGAQIIEIQSKEVSKVFAPSVSSLMNPQNKKIKRSTMLLVKKSKFHFLILKNEMVWGLPQ